MRTVRSKYSGSTIDVAEVGASISDAKPDVRSVKGRIRRLAGIVGIPFAAPPPKARRAIAGLTSEINVLRRMIEVQRARIADLERLADEDVLAPVANRRAFERELARRLSYDTRHGASSAVIYFDLDGLKIINDCHGHAAGDAAITRVAGILRENVRDSDLAARLGGDEFGVLLPQADIAAAHDKAQSLARRVESCPLHWNGAVIPLSVSHGVHALLNGEPAGAALDAADRAMYARKRLRSGDMAAR